MNNYILRARNISKSFSLPQKVQVLSKINLDLKKRESIAIMGPSGEGKTTLLYILGTLEVPTGGELEIASTKIVPSIFSVVRSRYVGFIFQTYNLIDDLTALENVMLPLKIARKRIKKGNEEYIKCWELLKYVGLQDKIDIPAKLLSGGEKQRIAIARSLCNDPDIILADEPSGSLDHPTSEVIHELLFKCVKEKEKSLIVVTHNIELATLCDKIFMLKDGQLLSS